MEIPNLNQKVKEAKEAVEGLEEPLKTEAFKKILDKLLEVPSPVVQIQTPSTHNEEKKVKKKTKKNGANLGKAGLKIKEEADKRKRELAQKLSRSQYPKIYEFKSILPQAVYILKIMKEKNVKGLTPPEIQFILKEVFGIKQTPEAISVALNRKEAMKYTDRSRIVLGKTVAYLYEIMNEGENFLKNKMVKNDHGTRPNEEIEPD